MTVDVRPVGFGGVYVPTPIVSRTAGAEKSQLLAKPPLNLKHLSRKSREAKTGSPARRRRCCRGYR